MRSLSVAIRVGYAHVGAGSVRNPAYNANIADTVRQLSAYTTDGALTDKELASLPEVIRARIPPGLSGSTLSALLMRINAAADRGTCTSLTRTCTTPQRQGLYLGVAVRIGGDGFGWDAEPYVVTGSEFFSVGVYTGPKLDFQLASPLYLAVGLGARLAYVTLEGWKYGADIYGRLPLRLTYYSAPNVALELEGSFGIGLSGYATDPKNYLVTSAPEFKFGQARSWDLTLGVRFE